MSVILNLTIKRRWFDMIASGEKREEYRDCGNPQVKRFWIWAINDDHWGYRQHFAVFRNGYRMDSRALAVEIVGIGLRCKDEVRHPEWGEPTDMSHFAIMLGDVVVQGTYASVKENLEKGEIK